MDCAKEIFKGSGIQVTAHDQRHLGAAIGSQCFPVTEKGHLGLEEILALSNFAQTHSTMTFTQGVVHKWNIL